MSRVAGFPSTSTPTSNLIEGFRRDCQIRGLSKGSIPRYLSVIKIFSQYLEQRGVDLLKVDRVVLRDFLEYLRLDRNVAQQDRGKLLHRSIHPL